MMTNERREALEITLVTSICILSILIIGLINVEAAYLEKKITIPYVTNFSLCVDFMMSKYGFMRPNLELILSNSCRLRVYLNEKMSPVSGVYLLNNSLIIKKNIMLSLNSWYRLIINSSEGLLSFQIFALNESYVATDIVIVPTLFSQGLAFGENSWFFTGTSAIYRLTSNMSKVIKYNDNPIPEILRRKGYFHLGDLDYYDGMLLVPIERTNYVKPAIIAVYDPSTLRLVGYSYTSQDHMPWIAADESGYIYTSEYSPVDRIYVYHISQIAEGNFIDPVRIIRLSKPLRNVQGGAVLSNYLLLTADDGDHVYRIDLETGNVSMIIRLPGLYEMEGIEVVALKPSPRMFILVNTHEEDNLVYCYELMRKGSRMYLFGDIPIITKRVTILYDKDVKLGSIRLFKIAPKTRGREGFIKNRELMLGLGIVSASVMLLLMVKMRWTLRRIFSRIGTP